MPEISEGFEENIKDRVEAAKSMITTEVTVIKMGAKDFIALKPVKGAVDIVCNSVSVVGDFIKRQAAITRRWIGE